MRVLLYKATGRIHDYALCRFRLISPVCSKLSMCHFFAPVCLLHVFLCFPFFQKKNPQANFYWYPAVRNGHSIRIMNWWLYLPIKRSSFKVFHKETITSEYFHQLIHTIKMVSWPTFCFRIYSLDHIWPSFSAVCVDHWHQPNKKIHPIDHTQLKRCE